MYFLFVSSIDNLRLHDYKWFVRVPLMQKQYCLALSQAYRKQVQGLSLTPQYLNQGRETVFRSKCVSNEHMRRITGPVKQAIIPWTRSLLACRITSTTWIVLTNYRYINCVGLRIFSNFSKLQSCPTLGDPMDCSLLCPCRLLCLLHSPRKNTGEGCHALLQRIFPTQESNPCLLCLLHCRQILYPWATWYET